MAFPEMGNPALAQLLHPSSAPAARVPPDPQGPLDAGIPSRGGPVSQVLHQQGGSSLAIFWDTSGPTESLYILTTRMTVRATWL